ncbi:MAG: iron chelate uptake ABC transporter family permease subunit, partial [Fretibacterium sp.]|nr:iron chelate uptake ABC transporter family permease subunit [Fretibacterium sp.]
MPSPSKSEKTFSPRIDSEGTIQKGANGVVNSGANRVIGAFILSLAVTAVICLGLGRFYVPLLQSLRILTNALTPLDLETTWSDKMETVVLSVRLPRLAGAMLVGSALSLSGATYQSLFRNPLVSPDLLGISSGACVGAAFAILMDLPSP